MEWLKETIPFPISIKKPATYVPVVLFPIPAGNLKIYYVNFYFKFIENLKL